MSNTFQPLLGKPLSAESRNPLPLQQAQASAQLFKEMAEVSGMGLRDRGGSTMSTPPRSQKPSKEYEHVTYGPTAKAHSGASIKVSKDLESNAPGGAGGTITDELRAQTPALVDKDPDVMVAVLQRENHALKEELLALKAELVRSRDERLLEESRLGSPSTSSKSLVPRVREILEQLLGLPRTVVLYSAAGDLARSVRNGAEEGSTQNTDVSTVIPRRGYPVQDSSTGVSTIELPLPENIASNNTRLPFSVKCIPFGLESKSVGTSRSGMESRAAVARDGSHFSQSKPIFMDDLLEQRMPARAHITCARASQLISTDRTLSQTEVCYRGRGKRAWFPEFEEERSAKRTKPAQQNIGWNFLEIQSTGRPPAILDTFCAIRYNGSTLLGSILGSNEAQKLQINLEFGGLLDSQPYISLTIRHASRLTTRSSRDAAGIKVNWFPDTQIIDGAAKMRMMDSIVSHDYSLTVGDRNIPQTILDELASAKIKKPGKLVVINMQVRCHQSFDPASTFAPKNNEWKDLDDKTRNTLQNLLQAKGRYKIVFWIFSPEGLDHKLEWSCIAPFRELVIDPHFSRNIILTHSDRKDYRL